MVVCIKNPKTKRLYRLHISNRKRKRECPVNFHGEIKETDGSLAR